MNKPKLGIIAYKALSGGVIVIFEHAYYLTLRNQYEVFLIFDTEVTDQDISWFDRATTLNKISFEEVTDIFSKCSIAQDQTYIVFDDLEFYIEELDVDG